MKFTENQRKIIEQINGPVITVACPGSGKTTTVLERTKHMIESGINPKNILVVTFTKSAAEEMEKRFREKYGDYQGVTFSTIHSLCFSVLCRYDNLNGGSILKVWEQWNFIKREVEKFISNANDVETYTKNIIGKISYVRNAKLGTNILEKEVIGKTDGNYLDVYKKYQSYKKKEGKVDFDDMLIRCHEVFNKDKAELEYWQDLFPYIIIDEFQDTNLIQAEIFYMMAEKYHNICVVGDDDQSIYGFRSADSSIMLNFEKTFPGAKKFDLSTNYRSGTEIVRQAGNLIAHNKVRFPKKFLANATEPGDVSVLVFNDGTEEIKYIAEYLKTRMDAGDDLNDVAILYRINDIANLPVLVLNQLKIPFQIKDLPKDIHKEFPFRDLIAYYTLANTPKEEWKEADFITVLSHPGKFFKKDDWKGITDYSLKSMKERCRKTYSNAWQCSHHMEDLENLYFLLDRLKGKNPQKFVKMVINSDYCTWAADFGKYIGKDEENIKFILDTLKEEALQFDNMEEWLGFIGGFGDILKMQNNKKTGVTLSTFHGAKGLEWDTVIIIDANDGMVPYKKAIEDAEIEEERRAFYVAVTRAKNTLMISSVIPSYFISEMNGAKPIHPLLEEEEPEEKPKAFVKKKPASA